MRFDTGSNTCNVAHGCLFLDNTAKDIVAGGVQVFQGGSLVFTVWYHRCLQQYTVRVSNYKFLTFVLNVAPREFCAHVWVCC